MPVDPRSEDEIDQELQDRISGKIVKLTNFVSGSFNKLFLNTFAEQIHEFEIKLLAVQLSGWVDYAGGPVEPQDLRSLGIDFRDANAVEQHLENSHLDQLGKIVGVDRDPGTKASGQVTVQTASDTTLVSEGMEVSTDPDEAGEYLSYFVDADGDGDIDPGSGATASPSSGNTEVTVDIIANGVGNEFNVGPGSITYLPSPPPGVEGVSNTNAVDGGENREENDPYRERIKGAVFESSGGGTVEGIKGFILRQVDGVRDVLIDEFTQDHPTHVDVIVDGGSDIEVTEAIENSRPAGVPHDLVRPESQYLSVTAELRGTDIDTSIVTEEIEDYLFEISLSEDFIRDELIRRIMNSDTDIENILALNVHVVRVEGEKKEYQSGVTQYDLYADEIGFISEEQHHYDGSQSVHMLDTYPVDDTDVTVRAIVNGTETTLTQGTDYQVVDSDGDGELDAIDFSVGGDNPDASTAFETDYGLLFSVTDETHTYSSGTDVYALNHIPVSRPGAAITDNSGDTYTLGTDFDVIDDDGDGVLDSVDFSIGGASPADAEDFFVDYELQTATIEEVTATVGGTEDTLLTEDSETITGDYDEADLSGSGYYDTIDFGVGGDSPDAGTRYDLDYYAHRSIDDDWRTQVRQKVVPATNEIEVITYA